MNVTRNFCFYIIAFLLLLGRLPAAIAVTTDELASICETMESAIADISLEYEWYNDSPLTLEEKLEYIAGKGLLVDVNIPRYKFSAACSSSARDPNDPNFTLFDRLLFEESTTVMNADGNTKDSLTKASYNGKTAKYLQVGGWTRTGGISHSKRYFMLPINLTPIGFSVLRVSNDGKSVPLSARLGDKEFVRLDNTVEKVNGFNTIRADFLIRSDNPNINKMLNLRVYFSVDHGYTPVRYDYMRGRGQVAFAVEVHSLEQVAEGLWFPSSGLISSPDDEEMNVYMATSRIIVNQGLTDEHFDIEFPPGTEVWDEIRDLEYVVKPTEEQFEQ